MLIIFRRHLTKCKHANKGRKYRACGCPLSVEGTLDGKMIRRALDIRNWEAAQKIVREWESGNGKLELPDVKDAMDRFIADLNSRGLSREHIRKAELLRDELIFHFPATRIDKVTADELGKIKEGWNVRPSTAIKAGTASIILQILPRSGLARQKSGKSFEASKGNCDRHEAV